MFVEVSMSFPMSLVRPGGEDDDGGTKVLNKVIVEVPIICTILNGN